MKDDRIGKEQISRLEDRDLAQEMDITEAVKNSPVLSRLVEEVRMEQVAGHQSYNRMHNRHNRSR